MSVVKDGIHQTSGIVLDIEDVTDGHFLKRSGTTVVGAAGAPPSGAAGGDLTGTYPNPTIGANAVTYAKMQQVSATAKVLGRSTAGAGNVEEIPCTSTGRAIIAANAGGPIADATDPATTMARLNDLLAFFRGRGDLTV